MTIIKIPDNPYKYDPEVWGPHFWFFMHTAAMTYPKYPNAETKRIYYDLFSGMYQFLPLEENIKLYQRLLVICPITPYLDNRDTLVKWVHYFHNKVNIYLEKPTITMEEFIQTYYAQYQPKKEVWARYFQWRNRLLFFIFILLLLFIIIYLYRKKY